MTPAEKIVQKSLVASGLSSREWNGVQAGLRDRAFFSSRVESARFLHAARGMVSGYAAGGLLLCYIVAVLPIWFVGTVLVLALMFWRQRGVLMRLN